jgi:hypothetical protein
MNSLRFIIYSSDTLHSASQTIIAPYPRQENNGALGRLSSPGREPGDACAGDFIAQEFELEWFFADGACVGEDGLQPVSMNGHLLLVNPDGPEPI